MTRVLCAEQTNDPNTTQPDTLFIVEIGVNTQPKIIFEQGLPNNAEIPTTPGAKYYKITAAGQPSESQASASKGTVSKAPIPATEIKVPVFAPVEATTPAAAAASASKATESTVLPQAPTPAPTQVLPQAPTQVLPQAPTPTPRKWRSTPPTPHFAPVAD